MKNNNNDFNFDNKEKGFDNFNFDNKKGFDNFNFDNKKGFDDFNFDDFGSNKSN